MPRADMAESVDHTEVGEDAAANHDILDHGGIGAGTRDGWSLRARRRQAAQQGDRHNWAKAGESIAPALGPPLKTTCEYPVQFRGHHHLSSNVI
jgi:hypothetical protein